MRLVESDNNIESNSAMRDSDPQLTHPGARGPFSPDGLTVLSTSQVMGNGNTYSMSNGSGPAVRDVASPVANGRKHSTPPDSVRGITHVVPRVNLPGTRLFEDSCIDREEFVRLLIQSLRDVGYLESATTLEMESGYQMEAPGVSQFRSYVLSGKWTEAESCLSTLGVTDEESLRITRFLISQQKYLELLEVQNVNTALHVLRNELAPLNVDVDELHSLSSLIMCSNADDLRHRAKWDGASGTSRRVLLSNLQRFISPSTMMPQRRFTTLIEQAFTHQRTNCLYHNTPYTPEAFSLYTDHACSREEFPLLTTNILKEHADEVWNIKWSHDGQYLASASKDKCAFIWLIGKEVDPVNKPNVRECSLERRFRDHMDPVGCLAWSPNDALLLTSTDSSIKVWSAKTGICLQDCTYHEETVSALEWLPDGSGFLSAGLDRKIILWNADGERKEEWTKTTVRVTDLAIAPDLSRLVIVGLECLPLPNAKASTPQQDSQTPSSGPQQPLISSTRENRLIIYDYASRTQEVSIRLEGELTSVKISQDSRYALINHAPDEVQLWDLDAARLARKFTGQHQGQHVIRSCFGGVDGNFIVSGSEDGNVYIWHRDTGALLEVLSGHGSGSVNAVAWNPTNERMFASCSDDGTIRIWESPHVSLLTGDSHRLQAPQGSERNNWKGKGRDASGLPTSSSLSPGVTV
ncbi:WD40 repeat-like protein [Fomitiporia mediterranea MF3/22]|uniref:WD40 repeat-like protein n=1 Tax=Fomitiporia mediterranea (strain MF3/22) TaxID=694068 RepID=UPI0004409C53|nr:WD40 repeat-like protein [Fomitiporia mediterranea MF3/22]EJD05675.1 WD40 repeat-like protein [Fomitiporia mediterranea MF3/22]